MNCLYCKKANADIMVVDKDDGTTTPFCSRQKLYDLLREMTDANYLACDQREYGDKSGRSHEALHYKLINIKKFEFPTSAELIIANRNLWCGDSDFNITGIERKSQDIMAKNNENGSALSTLSSQLGYRGREESKEEDSVDRQDNVDSGESVDITNIQRKTDGGLELEEIIPTSKPKKEVKLEEI